MKNLWLFRLLGFHDKKQAEKSKEVTEYARGKQDQYEAEMQDIRKMVKKAHHAASLSLRHAQKTVKITEDITQRIAVVSEKRRLGNTNG